MLKADIADGAWNMLYRTELGPALVSVERVERRVRPSEVWAVPYVNGGPVHGSASPPTTKAAAAMIVHHRHVPSMLEVQAADIEDAVQGGYRDATTASPADTQPAAQDIEHCSNGADPGHDRPRRA